MKCLKIIMLLLLMSSCAFVNVHYDYDPVVDFSKYKTYNYYSDMETGLSELDTRRLLDALDAKMEAKGFHLSDTPDFFIDINSSVYQTAQQNTVGVGLGGGGGNVGGGISIGIPVGQTHANRQITFDFVDETKKQLFWQAVSRSRFNINALPEKREARLKEIVDKVFLEYPPH